MMRRCDDLEVADLGPGHSSVGCSLGFGSFTNGCWLRNREVLRGIFRRQLSNQSVSNILIPGHPLSYSICEDMAKAGSNESR